MEIESRQLRIEYFKSSGPGGQHKNKRFTAVKVTHIPTGIFSVAAVPRKQAQNKKTALERLKRKIEVLTRKRKKRIPVKIPRSVKEAILETKRKNSQKKLLRRKVHMVGYDSF